MLHSSKHHLDIMFAILCVIAGASSHFVSNTNKSLINQLSNRHKTSFMDFILDASLNELLLRSNLINKELASDIRTDHKSTAAETRSTKFHQQSQTVCSLLSNLFLNNQMKFCNKHLDVIETILPRVVQLTKSECARITADLKWNCTQIDLLLDRSSPLAFTKEAALVRSILNASMMYLVAKLCSSHSHSSCGCISEYNSLKSATPIGELPNEQSSQLSSQSISNDSYDFNHKKISNLSTLSIDRLDFSENDLTVLQSGSALRLIKPVTRHQGCTSTMAFASALTQLFIDSDDTKALNKAFKILNENRTMNNYSRNVNIKRTFDSDYKDLAFIKWTKSAVNLHNNNVGRQMVREATHRKCRCHGLSGLCQFQTCWDQLHDFSVITSRLRVVYLSSITQVEANNLGSYEDPDLTLARSISAESINTNRARRSPRLRTVSRITRDDNGQEIVKISQKNRPETSPINSGELMYLYESPDYCESQPKLGHLGTKGRVCVPKNNNITTIEGTSKKVDSPADTTAWRNDIMVEQKGLTEAPGSCELLCCSRGYQSELVLDMVTCNCRFRFCCKVECDFCLKQQVRHICM